ncbi:MAG: sulfite reductase [NADPH] flavoprotein alpha-component [Pelagibacterium sp. SCN 64-44]|nr:MAG: sulfite reductase [NADPH] flavoprotein alpha-component [Pelagibacterium sp. SCN 64-44]
MTTTSFPGPGLSEEQWARLKALAISLSPEQSNWIGGYFTGYADAARGLAGAMVAEPSASVPVPTEAAAQRSLTVLYASETGTAMSLAEEARQHAAGKGLTVKLHDLADYKPATLKDEQDVLLIASTHGEGEPPQPALDFFDTLGGRKAPRLQGVRFAVLALGDSTYEFYCQTGRTLDSRLAELGGERLKPRIDCDVDQVGEGRRWFAALIDGLAETPAQAPATVSLTPVAAPFQTHGENNPFRAEILENIAITGRGSSKQTRHVELSLEGSGLTYLPGDALGIVPRNSARRVEEVLAAAGLAASARAVLDDDEHELGALLETGFEIAAATPRFLDHWASLSDAAALRELAQPDRASERNEWLNSHHVVDILRLFPVKGLDATRFIAGLRRLQPRFYSIASSQEAQGGDVHLTVSTVRYELHGTQREGVVSGTLAGLAEGETLPVFMRANPHFRLPADDVPMVMIGAGTGVAPYRGFVQERALRGAAGRSWLIFGDRNFRSDFLYQAEWQAHQKAGALSLIDAVFSRDGAQKSYVQDRLRERAAELYAWLEEGAHLYVCGDAAGMAPDVHQALIEAVGTASGRDEEAAKDYVRALQRDGRYQRDVY